MARELPRILTALGAVIASVGLVIYGMGIAYREPRETDIAIGVGLMVGGLVAFAVGLAMYKFGFGGSGEIHVEPAQPAQPRQAVHPPSARPEQAARSHEPRGRSRSDSRKRR